MSRDVNAVQRGYSTLSIKSFDHETRTIEGTASTPSVDRVGDIVEPMGAKFNLPMPLLWQHRHAEPVGHVVYANANKDGIPFRATIAKIEEEGELKNMCDRAWQSVKAKLVGAVSIGFRIKDHEPLDAKDPWGGWRIKEWEWLELSLVTIPANQDCTISTIRSIVADELAASGNSSTKERTPAGVTAPVKPRVVKTGKDKAMAKKSIAEQISAFEATRAAKAARMSEIMEEAGERGETLDAGQQEEYDGVVKEISEIDSHLKRLADLEKMNIAAARPVTASNPDEGSQSRTVVHVVRNNADVPPGTAFTRYVMALAASKGNLMQAVEMAKGRENWRAQTPQVEAALKAAVTVGTTTDSTWAAPLVQAENLVGEFIEYLRPATIIGRIPGLRRVPFNIKVPRQTTGAAVNWVGEAKPKPVSSLAFDQVTLGVTKIAGIIPLSNELIRFSSPSAEAIVRQDLTSSIAQLMDRDFIDPAKAAVANISPASITNGVTPVTASGTNTAAFRTDVQALMKKFLDANLSLTGAVWIMPGTQALSINMMQTALGVSMFPEVNAGGGTLFGLPVITSENIPGIGSPETGTRIVLAKATEILLADDGQVTIDASQEASLQMDSAPDSPPSATTVMISLWQNNMTAIKAERFINWLKRRAEAVQYINNAAYVGG